MWSEWSECKGQIKTRSRSHFGMNCETEDCMEIIRCGKYTQYSPTQSAHTILKNRAPWFLKNGAP